MKRSYNTVDLALPASAASVDLSHHPKYRADIDGLRAVAVLAVVLFHAFPALAPGGFIGVDIFFVISGFLITGILAREIEHGKFSFARFYARRIRRIFPALLLVMAACLAFGWFALFPDELKQLGLHLAGGAGFVSNVVLWQEVGYFDRGADTKPLLHLWSLAIEEQFYIVWPVVLLLASKLRLNLLLVSAGLALLSFAVNVAGISAFPGATFYSPASRAWELLLGAVLACSLHKAQPVAVFARAATAVSPNLRSSAGALLLAIGLAIITRERQFPGWYALLPVAGAVLVIGAGSQAWFNRFVLSNRVLVWFGLVSYPLYLWHWPLLSFAHIVESGTPAPQLRAGLVVLAIALAWLTWRLVERPLRFGPGRHTPAVLACLMAVLAASGIAIWAKAGMPQRDAIVDNARHQKSLVLVEDVENAATCKKRYGFDTVYQYCLLARPDQQPTVALLGDSHAYHVAAGLTRYYNGQGENLLYLGTRHPYWGLEPGNEPYQQATQGMLEQALGTASIRTVVFSTHLRLDDSTPEARVIHAAARDTIRRFVEAGKQVILMEDVPILSFDPRACIKRAGIASSATRSPCALPRAEVDQQTPGNDTLVAAILRDFPTVKLFRTRDLLCDDKLCWAMKDGKLLYRDKDHLSYDGDLYIGEKFAQWQALRGAKQAGNALQ
ncbi:acyltransferase family protein [Massilia sp. GCM10020059]|uniref:Acyltransferase n=1 Tax=Massilia agrisoli TaxID=2892444 RepID=A0ABS8INK8_9BURK|nr:acyltransferase family protein [Massilia agrisoli]MCC6069758.1 acyltransferase [Massilia agrisoli]